MSARETLEGDGIVRVAGAIDPEDVRAMRACARERIAAIAHVEIAGGMRPVRGTQLELWAIGREPAFAAMAGALARALDHAFGAGAWTQVEGELGGLAMPVLPGPDARWTACGVAWHVDEPALPGGVPGGVLLGYAFLDRVEPGGGAIVAIAGSHRRLAAIADRRGSSIQHSDASGVLADAEPWFADLVRDEAGERYLVDGCVSDGIPLRAVELTGEPGEIVFLDPRCLHTISANVSSRPRLIMRLTCVRDV